MDHSITNKMQVGTPSSHQWSYTRKHHKTGPIWLGHAQNPQVGQWHVTS